MPSITGTWRSTPNKTDNSTRGYTNKVLLNFQAPDKYSFSVSDEADIIQTLLDSYENIKGINILPSNYFKNADGRTFRISMYYYKQSDGNGVNLEVQLLDFTYDNAYKFNFEYAGTYSNGENPGLIRFECYLSAFKNPDNAYIAQCNGNAMYPEAGNSSQSVRMLQMSGWNDISSKEGIDIPFKIRIINFNKGSINLASLVIEEIS
jgi:hypothetical protein